VFELFPAFLSTVSIIVAVALFVIDRRAARDPQHQEVPRPRAAPVSPEHAEAERRGSNRRPSMRA
jgi:hypothetical protein